MQASWIDSDELRALAAGLQEPVEEIHEEVWIPEPLLDDAFSPGVVPAFSPVTTSTPVAIPPVSEPTAELRALHDQLRSIREEAQAAGLLPVVQAEPTPVIVEPSQPQEPPVVEQAPACTEEPFIEPQSPVIDAPVAPEPPSLTQQPELTEMSQRLQNLQQFATELTACKDFLLLNQSGDLLWGNTQHYDIMATIMMAMRYHNPTASEVTHFKLTNLDDTLVVLSAPTRHGQVFLALLNAVHADDERLQKLNQAMVAAIEGTGTC